MVCAMVMGKLVRSVAMHEVCPGLSPPDSIGSASARQWCVPETGQAADMSECLKND